MSVVGNTASEIGDVLEFESDLPMAGVTSLIGLVESYTNETATRYWDKEYRISKDGINFSPTWVELTLANLTAEDVDEYDLINFKFRLTRAGTDATGMLGYTSIQTQANYSMTMDMEAFEESVFSELFDSPHEADVLQWCVNLLNKTYKPGIVPIYHERNENNNLNGEDDDYIAFWKSICCFFGIIVAYARKFEKFYEHNDLIYKFLLERGLYVCSNTSLEDMQYLMGNIFDEARKRGTDLIAIRKGDEINVTGDLQPVDGELLRLLCLGICDELVFDPVEPQHSGWFGDNSSPTYNGVERHLNANKMQSKSDVGYDAVEIAKFPTFGTVTSVVDGGEDVIQIDAPGIGLRSGIGYDFGTTVDSVDLDKFIPIDRYLGYVLEFEARGSDNTRITVAIECVNEGLSSANKTRKLIVPSILFDPIAIDKSQPSTNGANVWSKYKVLLFPKSAVYADINKTTAPEGALDRNLQIWGSDVCYALPQIYNDNTGAGVTDPLLIKNIKFAPMATTNCPTAFMDVKHWYNIFYHVNASEYTEEQLRAIIESELVPMGSTVNMQPIPTE